MAQSYAISPEVQGEVTLQSSTPMSKGDLWAAFERVLELNGAFLRNDGDFITISSVDGAPVTIAPPGALQSRGGGVVAVPLQHIGVNEMLTLLGQLVVQKFAWLVCRTAIFCWLAARKRKRAAIDAINLFDTDVMKGKSIALYKWKAIDPESAVTQLKSIFDTEPEGALDFAIKCGFNYFKTR